MKYEFRLGGKPACILKQLDIVVIYINATCMHDVFSELFPLYVTHISFPIFMEVRMYA